MAKLATSQQYWVRWLGDNVSSHLLWLWGGPVPRGIDPIQCSSAQVAGAQPVQPFSGAWLVTIDGSSPPPPPHAQMAARLSPPASRDSCPRLPSNYHQPAMWLCLEEDGSCNLSVSVPAILSRWACPSRSGSTPHKSEAVTGCCRTVISGPVR